MPKSEEFWARLESAMESRNLRPAGLARETAGVVKESTIAHWKSGHSGPSVDQLAAVASALGMSMDELWGLRDMRKLTIEAGRLSKPESDLVVLYRRNERFRRIVNNIIAELRLSAEETDES